MVIRFGYKPKVAFIAPVIMVCSVRTLRSKSCRPIKVRIIKSEIAIILLSLLRTIFFIKISLIGLSATLPTRLKLALALMLGAGLASPKKKDCMWSKPSSSDKQLQSGRFEQPGQVNPEWWSKCRPYLGFKFSSEVTQPDFLVTFQSGFVPLALSTASMSWILSK